jgi:titin
MLRFIQTIICLLNFLELPSIILHNQIPKGMQKSETVMQMEATIKKYTSEIFLTEDDLFDPDRKQPPRFVTQILSQEKLVEMQSTKFECQLAPVGDPNMRVEWFFNGKPLSFSRINFFVTTLYQVLLIIFT